MKVQIVKYLNPKGKVVEMRKDNFKGRDLPENIIEEYEVEIKGDKAYCLEDLKIKYITGNYIIIISCEGTKWETRIGFRFIEHYKHIKLIHNKHKDILEAYLKNPSVRIETGMFAPMTGETEPSKWVDLEKDFIEDYNEEFWYRLKVKDLAWYEEKDNFRMTVKQIKSFKYDTENDGEIYTMKKIIGNIGIMEKITDNIGMSSYEIDGSHIPLQLLECYIPATEAEALSLVYKPQRKVPKEKILVETFWEVIE